MHRRWTRRCSTEWAVVFSAAGAKGAARGASTATEGAELWLSARLKDNPPLTRWTVSGHWEPFKSALSFHADGIFALIYRKSIAQIMR
jgi:hypothetical protein